MLYKDVLMNVKRREWMIQGLTVVGCVDCGEAQPQSIVNLRALRLREHVHERCHRALIAAVPCTNLTRGQSQGRVSSAHGRLDQVAHILLSGCLS